MTTPQRFERDLTALLEDLYLAGTPDYRDDLVQRVAATRQRPAWTFPERWLPMDIATTRVPTARFPVRAIGVLVLIGLLIAAALTVYVGSQPRLPAPFGVAVNGVVAYVDDGGAIRIADPITGQSDEIVSGPGNERPVFSPDGTHLAYLREVAAGRWDIVVVLADGRQPTVITPEPLATVGYLGWSPDSDAVMTSVPPGRLEAYDAFTRSAPRRLSAEGQELGLGLDDFNADIRDIHRPPAGDEVLFLGSTPAGSALFVANTDGTNARSIVDHERSPIPYARLDVPQWSPDGTRIAFALEPPDAPDTWRIHIVNADGTGLRELSRDPRQRSEGHPSWSPDGTRVAFQRWLINDECGPCVPLPITVVGVDDGVELEVGIVNVDGYRGWNWSPDGRSILEVAQNVGDDRLQIAPSAGGPPQYLDATTTTAPSWQRTAD